MEVLNNVRLGNFTSSEIGCLMAEGRMKGSFGKPALTYIEECNYERKLGRSIQKEVNSKPVTWGQAVESRIFNVLGTEYKIISKQTIMHPLCNYWAGSPDAEKFDDDGAVVDFKCPITLDSFCKLAEPLTLGLSGMDAMNWIRNNHSKGEIYYWQLVSNAILLNKRFAELIVYCPFKSELEAIQDMITQMDDPKQYRYKWIAFADQDELPWLPSEGCKYNNINTIRFEVSRADKDALTERVIEAGKLLLK